MTVYQAILTALFCMAVVFGVLVVLWGIISLFSQIIRKVEKLTKATANDSQK